jgi:hypothetical protein
MNIYHLLNGESADYKSNSDRCWQLVPLAGYFVLCTVTYPGTSGVVHVLTDISVAVEFIHGSVTLA